MNAEQLTSLENVINPKSLERQIRIIEQRLMELQSEANELEKRREACHILLGQPLAPIGIAESAVVTPPKKSSRTKKKERIDEGVEQENKGDEFSEEVSVIRVSELHEQSSLSS